MATRRRDKRGRFLPSGERSKKTQKTARPKAPPRRDPKTGRFISREPGINRPFNPGQRSQTDFEAYARRFFGLVSGSHPSWFSHALNSDGTEDAELRVQGSDPEELFAELEDGFTDAIERHGVYSPVPWFGIALTYQRKHVEGMEGYRLPFWRGNEAIGVNLSRPMPEYTFVFEAARYVWESMEASAASGAYSFDSAILRLHVGPERPPWY